MSVCECVGITFRCFLLILAGVSSLLSSTTSASKGFAGMRACYECVHECVSGVHECVSVCMCEWYT